MSTPGRKSLHRSLHGTVICAAVVCFHIGCSESPSSITQEPDFSEDTATSSNVTTSSDKAKDKALLIAIVPSSDDSPQRLSYLKENLEDASNSSLLVETINLPSDNRTQQGVEQEIESLLLDLNDDGYDALTAECVFVLGHGDGADLAASLASNSSYAGLIALGGKALPSATRESLKLPLLSLAGELDGSVWYTQHARAIEWLRKSFNSEQSDAYSHMPIAILEGVNAGQMAGGAEIAGDLPSSLDEAVAQKKITDAIRHFIKLHSDDIAFSKEEKQAAIAFFQEQNERSFALVEKFLEALSLEQGKWCDLAQHIIANPKEEAKNRLQIEMSNFDVWDPFGDFKPSSKTSRNADNQKIVIVSAANFADPWEDSTTWSSARNISCKLKTQEAIKEELNADRLFGAYVQCKAVNQKAFEWAIERVSNVAKSRYEHAGKTVVFLNDREVIVGTDWIAAKMPLKQSTKSPDTYEVRSTALVSDTWVPSVGGMHYCKLFSPAQAMEWILFESLK